MHVGEALIAATMAEGELFMVYPELVHDGGMQVVHVGRTTHHGISEVVRFTIGKTRTETTSRKKDAVAIHMMIATTGFGNLGSVRSASHFPCPEDDCLLQKAALLEIHDQGRHGTVGDAGVLLMVCLQSAMLVPR